MSSADESSGDFAPRYGDHFDGERFYNVPLRPRNVRGGLLKWLLRAGRDRGPWPGTRRDAPPGPAPPARVAAGEIHATFVNHATVLLQLEGLNLITDPIYAERASPVSFAGPRRVRPPGIRFEDLPPIDAVLLSHDHYDHLCRPTLERLHRRDRPPIFSGTRTARHLRGLGEVTELAWWEEATLGALKLTFVPAQHFSGRSLSDRNTTLWGGFVVAGHSGRVLFAGDTGEGPHFAEIRERLGPPDLALIPIGAYRPAALMQPVHLSPAEAVQAHLQVGARHSLAIHFGTFPMADDGEHEPVELLDEALAAAGLTREDFWVLEEGEGRRVSARVDSARA